MKVPKEKNKSIYIFIKIIMTSSHPSPLSWVEVIGVWNVRKDTTRKKNIVAVKYVSAASPKVVKGISRKYLGESVGSVTECSPETNATLTTVVQTKKDNRFVKSSINVENATKSCRTREEVQKLTCVGKKCVGTVRNLWTPIRTDAT